MAIRSYRSRFGKHPSVFTEADNPVSKYVLEYGINSGVYPYGVQDMGLNSRGQITYLVKFLAPSTAYYFKVRGGNGCATGTWSNEISATTKPAVTFNQLQITSSQLTPQPSTTTTGNCQTYSVKSGDTLWLIAGNLLGDGSKYTDIVNQNKDTYPSLATSTNLSVGWDLKVNCGNQTPAATTQPSTGPVVPSGYDVKSQGCGYSAKTGGWCYGDPTLYPPRLTKTDRPDWRSSTMWIKEHTRS